MPSRGRPRRPDLDLTVQIRISSGLISQIDALAEREGLTRSDIVRRACVRETQREGRIMAHEETRQGDRVQCGICRRWGTYDAEGQAGSITHSEDGHGLECVDGHLYEARVLPIAGTEPTEYHLGEAVRITDEPSGSMSVHEYVEASQDNGVDLEPAPAEVVGRTHNAHGWAIYQFTEHGEIGYVAFSRS